MTATFWLTDEDADIDGYLRAKLGSRSAAPSLIRAVTSTTTGPTTGITATRSAGGTSLAWITDPLTAVNLTAAAWTLHLWASESDAAANVALRFQVYPWTNAEGAVKLDSNAGTELTTTTADVLITTTNASATTMSDGDRLVFKVLFDDAASSMVTGYTATLAYNGEIPYAEGDSYVICPDTLAATAAIPTTTTLDVRRSIDDIGTDGSGTSALLTASEIQDAIESALTTYSMDRPYLATHAYNGDGSTYAYRLPRYWVHGFSRILDVEYPAGEQVRAILDDQDFEVVEDVLGLQPRRQLRFVNFTPDSGTANVLVRYTTRHWHDDVRDTIPVQDYQAFVWLAGSYAADMAAADSAARTSPSFGADVADHQMGQERWSSVAKRLRDLYNRHIGVSKDVKAAGGWIDWDTRLSTGERHLLVPRRQR